MGFPGISGSVTSASNFWLPTLTAIAGPSAAGTTHVFSGVNFGPDATNRLITVMVYAQGKPSSFSTNNVIYQNARVGGVPMYGGDPGNTWFFEYYSGGVGSPMFTGIVDAVYQPSGNNGSVTFNTNMTTQCSIAIMSSTTILNAPGTFANSYKANYIGSATSVSAAVDTPSLSTIFAGGICNDSGVNTSFSNLTLLGEFEHVSGYHCAVGYGYPIAQQTQRSTAYTKTGSAKAMCIQLDAWQ